MDRPSSPSNAEPDAYHWADAESTAAHNYLSPAVLRILKTIRINDTRLLDVGCGNGSLSAKLSSSGWKVTGVDPSLEGIDHARQNYKNIDFHTGSAYDDLSGRFGLYPVVVSLEVIEHVYFPKKFIANLFNSIQPGGHLILSTPYHGYLKNLVLALTGKMDEHFTALWDHGHIKFWSKKTLSRLLKDSGFQIEQFFLVGRIPPLAKSMVVHCRKPL